MAFISFPTSKDIYIEIDGRRLATAQSYKAKTTKESRYIEAFGSAEPVGTVGGRVRHLLELTRIIFREEAVGPAVQFHDLDDFNVVIVRPDRKIIYTGCRWSSVSETATLSEPLYETLAVVACTRLEVAV